MTIPTLLAHRSRTMPGAVLANDALNAMRYEALRSVLPKYFAALHASAIEHHKADEDFGEAMDRMVDVLILTRASDERKLQ